MPLAEVEATWKLNRLQAAHPLLFLTVSEYENHDCEAEQDIEDDASLGERPGYHRTASMVNDIPHGVRHHTPRRENGADNR